MVMTEEDGLPAEAVSPSDRRGPGKVSGRQLRELLADDIWLDELIDQAEDGGVALTGEGGFLPGLVKAVLERGLAAELTDHLGYGRGDPAGAGSGNSRNGSTPNTISTEVGPVELDTPRDRAGSFEPRLVDKGQRRLGGLDEMIISLDAGGMTVRDIGHHLLRTLGTELSQDTVSKITDAVAEEVKAWQAFPLEGIYPIAYFDALVVKVRDGHTVRNKSAHLAVGVDTDGVKHALGISVQSAEGAKFWAGVCAEPANRGVRNIIIACCDGLPGLPEAIEGTWPTTTVQTCVVHLIRAWMRFVSDGDRRKVAAGLRRVYTTPTAEAARGLNTPGSARNSATSARQSPPGASATARSAISFPRIVPGQRPAPRRQSPRQRGVQPRHTHRLDSTHPRPATRHPPRPCLDAPADTARYSSPLKALHAQRDSWSRQP